MVKTCLSSFVLCILGCLRAVTVAAAAAPPLWHELDENYSFEAFIEDFGKSYATQEEYEKRRVIFQENLERILAHNNHVASVDVVDTEEEEQDSGKQEGRKETTSVKNVKSGHVLGLNPFADLLPQELPTGLAKLSRPLSSVSSSLLSSSIASVSRTLQQKFDSAVSGRKASAVTTTSLLMMLNDPISELPKEVDWRTKGVTTPVKSQGHCGSCWAFASTAVLESHVAIQTGKLFELSEQELVSCAPNPLHCGGLGGCAGSIATIAFDYVNEHGMVQEYDFGYQSGDGANIQCKYTNDSVTTALTAAEDDKSNSLLRGRGRQQNSTTATTKATASNDNNTPYFKNAIASIAGYVELTPNNYNAVMNAVALIGPVAVSVACLPWHLYGGGVYTNKFNQSDSKSTDVDHLVVLEGYGTDPDTNEDFWLVRNSWSPLWGENGYIRLKRVDPSTLANPEDDCAMDTTPADGDACSYDKNGTYVLPKKVKICGNSGILSHSVVPLGAHLLDRKRQV